MEQPSIDLVELNPQPLPPDATIRLIALNPQPLPPDATIELVALNPQPLPPGSELVGGTHVVHEEKKPDGIAGHAIRAR